METVHLEIGDTTAQLILREASDYWQLRFSDKGKRKQISTKCKTEKDARIWATDWLMIAKGRLKEGKALTGTSFKQTANKFLEYEQATKSADRHEHHIQDMRNIANRWLIPYFHNEMKLTVEEIKARHLNDFLVWRNGFGKSPTQKGDKPAAQTQKHYLQVMRRILKYAIRREIIDTLPLFPEISLRKHTKGWFEPKEYELLKEVSRRRIREAPNVRVHQRREYLHYFIIFCVGCGARQGELTSLRHNGVERVSNFVRLTVKGKVGEHEITAMPSCRDAYEAILKHNKKYGISSDPDALVFPQNPHMSLRSLLKAAKLYEDKQGRERSARNFRHTAIMYRILNSENLSLKTIADNLNTSVSTIDKHYAEISNRLNEPQLL